MRPLDILLVEDSPGDAELTCEAFETSRLLLEIHLVTDGEEALAYLFRQPPHQDAPRPDIVLLDLNVPKLGGREILARMRADETLRHIPVVVLTSSDAEQDILESYRVGANCYVTKPVGLAAFQQIVRSVEGFWFTVVKLP